MDKKKVYTLIILVTVLSTEILFFWYVAPRMPIRRIVIHANFEVLEQDIYQLARLKPKMPIMQIDPHQVEALLNAESMIQEVKVKRGIFGNLYVWLRGYNPTVALITAEGKILFLDQDGFLFSSEKKTGIFPPLLQGARLESDEDGVIRLHSSMRPLLYALHQLKESDYLTHSNIAGIDAVTNGDILLYWKMSFIHIQTKAIFASYVQAQDIQRALVVLQILEEHNQFFKEVDFRTNEIVFKR
ncbi:FtsQ-type POTRA domain-containing protein [Entomospira entomophila]|uniref:FtsQ-type POTRA domain-containing protein n=1 Tax=Entomospira entomophila TaxID=2719988 RepID=A0A968KT68_9SPIO|nr:FtsQ-type POTRA domain-containing protein [Entomospira entomophilus]NIZ39976.1 FtsQ-type POTRA domain-containing protein [Entomospira entomophilus]WDI35536.1 FtsQ-type POTRA domain-containing protein [Entomospira entomophilus]